MAGAPGRDDSANRALAAAVSAPDAVLPWLDRFYDADETLLVLAAAERPLLFGGPFSGDALARAVRRSVLETNEAGAVAPASFHTRLAAWALFEGWLDVPRRVRDLLVAWDVAEYAASVSDEVEALRRGDATRAEDAYTYLLLGEAQAIVAAQEHVYLWPCDCRAIAERCRKPANVCLRFENDRGVGWEISRQRALQILREADHAGLMRTGVAGAGAHAICNCCADCCYPHQASLLLEAQTVWPHRRHAAVFTRSCRACGRCAKRCPFGAITTVDDARPQLDESLCRGCGLCATECAAGIIEMRTRA
jgi:Pyruvate/2-oxoacid:ferredoxin oxidoreductase delta subunit